MRIALASLKGGVGKTTTAIYLAELMAREAPTLLIDADDDQNSAVRWAETSNPPLSAVVRPSSRPSQDVPRLAPDYTHIIIDTPPKDVVIVTSAVSVADLVVVPLTGSPMELDRLPVTLNIVDKFGKPAVVLLTRTRQTTLDRVVLELLNEKNIPLLSTSIPLRAQVTASFGSRPKEMFGYENVWKEIKEIAKELGL